MMKKVQQNELLLLLLSGCRLAKQHLEIAQMTLKHRAEEYGQERQKIMERLATGESTGFVMIDKLFPVLGIGPTDLPENLMRFEGLLNAGIGKTVFVVRRGLPSIREWGNIEYLLGELRSWEISTEGQIHLTLKLGKSVRKYENSPITRSDEFSVLLTAQIQGDGQTLKGDWIGRLAEKDGDLRFGQPEKLGISSPLVFFENDFPEAPAMYRPALEVLTEERNLPQPVEEVAPPQPQPTPQPQPQPDIPVIGIGTGTGIGCGECD